MLKFEEANEAFEAVRKAQFLSRLTGNDKAADEMEGIALRLRDIRDAHFR